jgi:hypothetical protein
MQNPPRNDILIVGILLVALSLRRAHCGWEREARQLQDDRGKGEHRLTLPRKLIGGHVALGPEREDLEREGGSAPAPK